MADPKPIKVTYTAAGGYDGPEPQPFTIIGEAPEAPLDLTTLDGYDEGETQTLKNVAGVLTWVTDAE